jgi:spore coat protein A, manganese oxidase
LHLSRRKFVQAGIAAASATILPAQEHHHGGAPPVIRPSLRTSELEPFVDRLVIPPVAVSSGTRSAPGSRAPLPHYRLAMREIHAKVHRDMPATRFWSFGNAFPGPSVEVHKGKPVLIEWPNELPLKHFLPIDHALVHNHRSDAPLPEVRAVVHVHGARVPPESDGYPEAWYTPGQSRTLFYPNEQDATLLWYHDHAMGITRLNIFAGLLGAFIVRDKIEADLNLPTDEYEIPLILCDRAFDQGGQLNYPTSAKPGITWVPEFFGDGMLVNGKLSPFAEIKAAAYRLRLLNACNTRFLNLSLDNGQEFVQIGSDQGFLGRPVNREILSLAPGERADVIVDFSASRGTRIALRNDAPDIMQFRVGGAAAGNHFVIPASLRTIRRTPETEAVRTRVLSLDEVLNDFGDVEASLLNNQHWHEPVTEQPVINTTEIWSLVNTTDDTHPIHLHLVRFQVLDRQPFDLYDYQLSGKLNFTGPAVLPEPGEQGWKDTVRAFAQMVTRIIIRFEGYKGRYVWHCHILEHEDNDMMRPYEIVGAAPAAKA